MQSELLNLAAGETVQSNNSSLLDTACVTNTAIPHSDIHESFILLKTFFLVKILLKTSQTFPSSKILLCFLKSLFDIFTPIKNN